MKTKQAVLKTPALAVMALVSCALNLHAQPILGRDCWASRVWQLRSIFILYLAILLVFCHSEAQAQFNSIPLTDGALVKMIADFQRPYIYAIQTPASGATNGNLLFINSTNGSLVKSMTVGTNPTDIALSPAGDAVFVINAGSRTISKVDLNSFTVVAEKSILTPDAYSLSNPLHLTLGQSNLVYFTGSSTFVMGS